MGLEAARALDQFFEGGTWVDCGDPRSLEESDRRVEGIAQRLLAVTGIVPYWPAMAISGVQCLFVLLALGAVLFTGEREPGRREG